LKIDNKKNLNIMKEQEITILLPTFKRPDHLERLLESFVVFDVVNNISIIILDSSPIEFEKKYNELNLKFKSKLKINYQKYDSEIIFTKKILQGLKLVKTSYVIVATDDDMYNPHTILECVKKLNDNKNASNATGDVILIGKTSSQNYLTYFTRNNISDETSPINRGWDACLNTDYLITLNNVWRTGELINILEPISFNPYKKYTECMYDVLSSYTGKTILISKLMIVRTKNLSREEYRLTSLPNFNTKKETVFYDVNFQSDLKNFLNKGQELLLKNNVKIDNNKNRDILIRHFLLRFLGKEYFKNQNNLIYQLQSFLMNSIFLKIYKLIKFFKILRNLKNILILPKLIKIYGLPTISSQLDENSKINYNIVTLSKGNSSNSKDFKVIFESLKKFENKIDF
tara:strand:+ start:596 stop:1798 length:1203 start_codon:yes stop_codon:yes gene_type:complete